MTTTSKLTELDPPLECLFDLNKKEGHRKHSSGFENRFCNHLPETDM